MKWHWRNELVLGILAGYDRTEAENFNLCPPRSKSRKWWERDSNSGPPGLESGALTTRPLCFPTRRGSVIIISFPPTNRFLEEEHVPRCVTPAISSGYGKLPVNFEYINGVPSSELTTQKLPDGTPLNGPDGYKALLSFHTTTLVTPEEIRKMGQDRLQEMYKEVKLYFLGTSPVRLGYLDVTYHLDIWKGFL